MRIGRKFWLNMNSKTWMNSYDETRSLREALESIQDYLDKWVNDIEEYIAVEKVRRDAIRDQLKAMATSASAADPVLETDASIEKRMYLRFITWQCYQDMSIICNGVPQFIGYLFHGLDADVPIRFCPKRITQDNLEGDFCLLRHRAAGAGSNPTVYDVAFTLKSINKSRLAYL